MTTEQDWDQLDTERSELDIQPKDTITDLIMGFDPRKAKAPPLPPRDDISSSSSDGLATDDDFTRLGASRSHMGDHDHEPVKIDKNFLSIDTEKILRRARADESMDSANAKELIAADSLDENNLAYSLNKTKNAKNFEPLDPQVILNDQYLSKFKAAKTFNLYTVTTDFYAVEKRHLSCVKNSTVSGFT